jgi:hypothetical protein
VGLACAGFEGEGMNREGGMRCCCGLGYLLRRGVGVGGRRDGWWFEGMECGMVRGATDCFRSWLGVWMHSEARTRFEGSDSRDLQRW